MEVKILLLVSVILGLQLCCLGRTLTLSDATAKRNYKFVKEKSDCVVSPPSRRILGIFNSMDDNREEAFIFETNLGKISDIVINQEWLNGSGFIYVKGGITSNGVTISFDVPPGASLIIDMLLFTEGDSDNISEEMCENFLELSRNALKHMKENNDNIGTQVMFVSLYETLSETLLETYEIESDYEAKDCFGSTFWYNGMGAREFYGGIGADIFKIHLLVPAGVRAANMYSCVFSNNNGYSSWKHRSFHKEFRAQVPSAFDEDSYTCETYGSIYAERKTFYIKEAVTGVVQECDSEPFWKDGKGTITQIGGGVGFNYSEYRIDKSVGSYGTYESIYTVSREQYIINLLSEDND
ncbi:uncharacterized protein [Periplaneta americana]|uniref:uncharacterized protein n=1 Tax=Periplaneta americana TaxID=6978 RepID=UPI0037E8DF92